MAIWYTLDVCAAVNQSLAKSAPVLPFFFSFFLPSDPNPILPARESGVARKRKGKEKEGESATEAAPIALATVQARAGSAPGPGPGTHTLSAYLTLLKRLCIQSIMLVLGVSCFKL